MLNCPKFLGFETFPVLTVVVAGRMGPQAEAVAPAWGTWEDLVLGGAVMRHGTGNWNVVASELQARTLYPYAFTPQVDIP